MADEIRKLLGIRPSVDKVVRQTLEGWDGESYETLLRYEDSGRLLTTCDGVYMDLTDNLEAAGYKLDNRFSSPYYEVRVLGE